MILIADDNEIIVDMLTLLISSMGHGVDSAIDGETVVAKVKDGDYSLVIMDIRLIGMSGVQAAKAIRQLPAPKGSIPILALTGGMAKPSPHDISEARFDMTVQKPILPDQLRSIITALAGLP